MRKSYFIIATVAAVMASCSNNDTFNGVDREQNTEQAISFSAYADKVTRGTNSNALNDFYNVFAIYGWKTVDGEVVTDPVFYNSPNEFFATDAPGTTVYTDIDDKPSQEWVTTTAPLAWFYEDIRYWDRTADNYQFFAIAPYDSLPIYSVAPGDNNFAIATAESKYDITTEKNLAISGTPAVPHAALSYSGFNKDFMIADKKTLVPTATVANSDVQLVFHHLLTKLNVKIIRSNNYSGKQVLKVNELKIANLAKEGYYTYNTNMTTNGWHTSGKYDLDITTEYSLAKGAENYNDMYWIETLIFPQTTECKAKGAQTNANALTDLYLYLQYQIGSEKYNAYYDLAYVFNNNLAVGGDFEFKQGSQYNLEITVGPEPIHFAPHVIEWTTETNGYIVIE